MLFQISCQKRKKIVNCRPPTLRTKDDTYKKLPLQPQDSSPQNTTPKEAVKTTITTSVKKHHLVPWYEWTEASQQCRKKSWLSSQTLPNLTREFNIDFRELLHGTIAYRIVLEFQFIQECLTVYVHSSFPPHMADNQVTRGQWPYRLASTDSLSWLAVAREVGCGALISCSNADEHKPFRVALILHK